MFKEYFILLLLGHVLGDFYIQTANMSEKKEKSLHWVLIHCFCYWVIMLLVCLPIISWEIALAATVAAILHMVIDLIKFAYTLKKIKKGVMTLTIKRNVFFADQVLHGVCLFGITYWVIRSNVPINAWKIIEDFFDVVGVSEVLIISWALALLVIHKPANIVIQKLLMIYKPESKDDDKKEDKKEDKKKDNNAGRFIGTVERIIMLLFLSIGQFAAIGLVLTAKSIARYDKIAKEPEFAEYYLLGTLLSTMLVIIASFIM